jgi:hypothetical protein
MGSRLAALGVLVLTAVVLCWQPASATSSGFAALAVVTLAGVIIALLTRSAWLAGALLTGPRRQSASALRRRSRSAACQRQLDPDAAGHSRPRAPSAAPAAA